jgi:hypothetical protein
MTFVWKFQLNEHSGRTTLTLRVNSFNQANMLVMEYGQSILMRFNEKSLCRKLMTIMRYLNECIKEGLGLEVVRAAATMQTVPTTARMTVV